MNPDKTLHEHLTEHLQGMYMNRKADPQEGDVVKDLYGTEVFLDGQWNRIDYDKPEEVAELREKWIAMSDRQRASAFQPKKHRGIDIGSANGGVHLHDDGKEKPIVHILQDEELDAQTLEAFSEGRTLAQTVVAEVLASAVDLEDFKKQLEEHPQWLM